jgi:hypothetical protein
MSKVVAIMSMSLDGFAGVRLFDHLAGTPAVLGNPPVIDGVASHTCATRYTRRN